MVVILVESQAMLRIVISSNLVSNPGSNKVNPQTNSYEPGDHDSKYWLVKS